MDLPVSPGAVRGLLKELDVSRRKHAVLAVGGARELAAVLRRELATGAVEGAVRAGDSPEGAAVLVYVLGRDPSEEDEAALRRARRARVPVVAVAAGPVSDDVSIPYVLATDIVRVGAGEGFRVEAIAGTIAARLGEDAAPLAGRIPALRDAVCERLVSSFSRKNGVLAAAVFVPGADLPVLALNELRLVLRLAQAYGREGGRERLPELAATLGAGVGLRTVARELLDLVPFAGWLVKGGVAYTGTRALGEAARQRFELAGATPRPAAGAPAVP
ncbi:MAG TPA: DUF697 domain-containing protein [Gaiellaceae bacterium]|nr:DUF697 domain-containing protein [Gaiellaceae bacterium]